MSGYTVSPTTAALANHFFETLGCTEPQRRRFLQLEGAYERVRNLHGEAWAKAHFVEHWRTQEMARSDGVTIAIHDAVQNHLARAASGEIITDTCLNLNMGSTALPTTIPNSSSDPMSNSNPHSNPGLQPDTTWKSKSNSNSTYTTGLGRNPTSTSIPITTSNDSIFTADRKPDFDP